MRFFKTQYLRHTVLVLVVSFLYACEATDPAVASLGDYFPLEDGIEWTYSQTILQNGVDPTPTDDLNWRIDGDTTIDGKLYTSIVDMKNGYVKKVVRKEGSKYYGRNHELYGGFTHEYVFLDTDVAVGNSWHYLKFDGAMKTEYVVKAVDATRTVNGTMYENVLELEVSYYDNIEGEFQLNYSVTHAYAKGFGEIFSDYPYSPSRFFTGLRTELKSFKR
jgi:hypothetical protein